ncbi:MAG: hypothetical protein JKY92_04480 [Magnetovibrio sp.]|nr:hypothetical protein [Magnetovibrio sp.]
MAHLLDDAKAQSTLESEWGASSGSGQWALGEHTRIDAARAHLSLQEVLNLGLPGSGVRDGAIRFRTWWSSGAAEDLQKKHFRVALNDGASRELEILKNRVRRT